MRTFNDSCTTCTQQQVLRVLCHVLSHRGVKTCVTVSDLPAVAWGVSRQLVFHLRTCTCTAIGCAVKNDKSLEEVWDASTVAAVLHRCTETAIGEQRALLSGSHV